MVSEIQFTNNFSLYELLKSKDASRQGFDEQFSPPVNVIENLRNLCINLLQPIRDEIKLPITVSSGYRCAKLNDFVGGASKSQHLTGNAADIECFRLGNYRLLERIAHMHLPFDQMINEYKYKWVHVSWVSRRPRNEILEAYLDDLNRTQYKTISIQP
jgi:zinc D-Ala-D-Ala carboxypeptidase